MHENNKKRGANEAKPKKRAKEIKIMAGRGFSSDQEGVQKIEMKKLGPQGEKEARWACWLEVGRFGSDTGSVPG